MIVSVNTFRLSFYLNDVFEILYVNNINLQNYRESQRKGGRREEERERLNALKAILAQVKL